MKKNSHSSIYLFLLLSLIIFSGCNTTKEVSACKANFLTNGLFYNVYEINNDATKLTQIGVINFQENSDFKSGTYLSSFLTNGTFKRNNCVLNGSNMIMNENAPSFGKIGRTWDLNIYAVSETLVNSKYVEKFYARGTIDSTGIQKDFLFSYPIVSETGQ